MSLAKEIWYSDDSINWYAANPVLNTGIRLNGRAFVNTGSVTSIRLPWAPIDGIALVRQGARLLPDVGYILNNYLVRLAWPLLIGDEVVAELGLNDPVMIASFSKPPATGVCDGINRDFTLLAVPLYQPSAVVGETPVTPDVDFVWVDGTSKVKFAWPPPDGSTVMFDYAQAT